MSTILQEADKIAGEERSRDYGHPLENHERIADFWNTYLGDRMDVPLHPREVAIMMILLKIAREMHKSKRDNLADIAGYVKVIDMMDEKVAKGLEEFSEALAELSDAERNPIEVGQVWMSPSGTQVEITDVADGQASWKHVSGLASGWSGCDWIRRKYTKVSDPPPVSCSGKQIDSGNVGECPQVLTGRPRADRPFYIFDESPPPRPRYYYLATPYTSYSKGGLWMAHLAASLESARFIKAGIPVFSPIAHSHSIADYGKIDKASHEIWMTADEPLLAASRGVIVCKLPGWDKSKGIELEIEMAKKYGIPVYYMEPGVIPEIVNKECGK